MHSKLPVLSVMAAAAFGFALPSYAQQSGAYQGVSQPPSEQINASPDAPALTVQIAKPSAGVVVEVPAAQPPAVPVQYAQPAPQQAPPPDPSAGYAPSYPPPAPSDQAPAPQPDPLATRNYSNDPDGDIVHPRPARPGELLEGATIRVRLLDRLSSSDSEKGEPFHGQVASDVLQDGRVLIPAGSGLEGRVTAASAGHFGGHGSLRLKPEFVILPDGTRFQLHAETTGTPGSHTRMGAEGTINPGSRARRDTIEYGAVVGTGVITGAVIAGPVGAVTGGLVGAGIVTTHLMVDHPQATLEPNSVILFTLTDSMNLTPVSN